jgi:hypothetical protein
MVNTKQLFHYISYLQYPLMLIGTYYAFKPIIFGYDSMWEDYNTLLIFSGLGISFSTLQDTSKTQNTLSKRIWENPKYGKIALTAIAAMALLFILTGMATLFGMSESDLKELSLGLIVFGIGMIGMLKAAIEMFENHRADKRDVSSNPGQPQPGK